MEVEEEEDLKRSGEFEEVEEEKMEEEEEEERPLPPLPHLPPRAPAQDRGNQAMVFGIQCLRNLFGGCRRGFGFAASI